MAYRKFRGGAVASPIFKMLLAFMPFGLLILGFIYFAKPIKNFLSNIFGSFGSITDNIGLTNSDNYNNVTAEISNSESAFNPNYHNMQAKKKKVIISPVAYADIVAKKIHSSVNFWTPSDFALLMASIKMLDNKCKVSFMSERFRKLYNEDILVFLRGVGSGGFNSSQIKQVIDYVNSLPIT